MNRNTVKVRGYCSYIDEAAPLFCGWRCLYRIMVPSQSFDVLELWQENEASSMDNHIWSSLSRLSRRVHCTVQHILYTSHKVYAVWKAFLPRSSSFVVPICQYHNSQPNPSLGERYNLLDHTPEAKIMAYTFSQRNVAVF